MVQRGTGTAALEVLGFTIHQGAVAPGEQAALVADLRAVAQAAPFLRHVTPGGRQMSVRMTSAGRLGWISDARGYRYAERHPSGADWPPIPPRLLDLWRDVTELSVLPDSCLVNFYDATARMGLHRDDTEADMSFPVVSVSLGDDALFRMGGLARTDPTRGLWLKSGDVVVIGGAARLAYHGIDRLRHGSSRLLPQGGRINVTLRVAAPVVDPGAAHRHVKDQGN